MEEIRKRGKNLATGNRQLNHFPGQTPPEAVGVNYLASVICVCDPAADLSIDRESCSLEIIATKLPVLFLTFRYESKLLLLSFTCMFATVHHLLAIEAQYLDWRFVLDSLLIFMLYEGQVSLKSNLSLTMVNVISNQLPFSTE